MAWVVGAGVALTAWLTHGCAASTAPSGTGRLSVALEGAPHSAPRDSGATNGTLARAVVTIDRVYLQSADASAPEDPAHFDSEHDPGIAVLRTEPVTLDLMNPSMGTGRFVDAANVPGGRYTRLHLVISGGLVEFGNGAIYATPGYSAVPSGPSIAGPLTLPNSSGGVSDVEVPLPSDLVIEPTILRVVELDFDVEHAVSPVASGEWSLHPQFAASDVTQTAKIVVHLDASLLPGQPPATIRAELRRTSNDVVDGIRVERVTPVHYAGTFEFVEPSLFPLQLELLSDASVVRTEPYPLMIVSLSPGETKVVEVHATSIDPP